MLDVAFRDFALIEFALAGFVLVGLADGAAKVLATSGCCHATITA